MPDQPWTIVLAAGAGRRLHAITGGIPKQFWRGCGISLLDQTIQRFESLSPRARTVVIVDETHRRYIAPSEAGSTLGQVVVQPEDRGTAAGVLLALTPVLEQRPEAIVALTPSDHGVRDLSAFTGHLRAAVNHVRVHDDVLVFAVEPSAAVSDYGWMAIDRGRQCGDFVPVRAFVEKPANDLADRLFRAGAVWNTMIVVARARRLADLYAGLLPGLHALVGEVLSRQGTNRQEFLNRIYPTLPTHDFSREILGRAPALLTRLLPASLGWTDLGTPERLDSWQRSAVTQPSARVKSAA